LSDASRVARSPALIWGCVDAPWTEISFARPDATAAFSLRELAASCRRRHIRLVLSDVHTRPLADLDRHDLLAEIGRERVTATLEGAFAVLANEATATPAA
jgi:MFS superfamily sulfate permease-like transporter